MALKDNLKNLSKDIQEIAFLVEKFQNNSHLTKIETDLLKHKLQQLYGAVLKLENSRDEEIKVNKNDLDSPVEPTPTSEKEVINKPIETIQDEKEVSPSQPTSPEIESADKEPLLESRDLKNNHSATTDHQVLGDLLNEQHSFRNELLRNKEEIKDLSAKLQEKPISDISSAIGINERFMFIRELFNGDQALYTETIEALNGVASEEEARKLMSEKFDWNLNQGSAKDLLYLTQRKLKNKDNG